MAHFCDARFTNKKVHPVFINILGYARGPSIRPSSLYELRRDYSG